MAKLKPILASLVAVLLIIVVLQNTETVETRLLFATVSMPRAILLLVTFVAGGLVGLLLATRLSKRRG